MPTQTIRSVQQLFDGDVDASVPDFGWRSVSLFTFDRTSTAEAGTGDFRGIWSTYEYSATLNEYINTRFTCPPDRIEDTGNYYRWHFSTNAATSGDVVLQLQITGANVGDVIGTGTSQNQTVNVDTQYEHYIATFGPFGGALDIDGMHMLRFGRLGADGSDTYPDTIFHLDFQAWYQTARIAVPNHLPPYYS